MNYTAVAEMALPRDYQSQRCALARALEVVGERWTLLILRDAYYGVRRFTDFCGHLQIPRAVLTDRLNALVEAGLLERVPGSGGHDEYETTAKGRELWPAMLVLMNWGDEYYTPEGGPRRVFQHEACGTPLDPDGRCPRCDRRVELDSVVVIPGPGLNPATEPDDVVSGSLIEPHRMLTPLVPAPDRATDHRRSPARR